MTKRLGSGRYLTDDGKYLIESDVPSVGEAVDLQGYSVADEQPRASEWFVYDAAHPHVIDGSYGPPEALTEGFPTKREAVAFAERKG